MDARTLLGDHLATESMLAYQTVAGREVEDDLCPLDSQLGRRRQRRPKVLAYLYSEGIVACAEKKVCSERHFSAPYLYLRNARLHPSGFVFTRRTAGSEPAFLVKLTGVRQVHFGHHAHYLAVRDDENAVV